MEGKEQKKQWFVFGRFLFFVFSLSLKPNRMARSPYLGETSKALDCSHKQKPQTDEKKTMQGKKEKHRRVLLGRGGKGVSPPGGTDMT